MARSRIHQHHEHPLIWREGPKGLYPFPLFWMEGNADLEGFHASVCYAYIKEPCTFHPIEGMVTHPYDEMLVFVSTNVKDMQNLGAEVSITIGEEQETYSFDRSQIVCIPRGVPHGPVTVKSVDVPFVHYTISMSPDYCGEYTPASALGAPVCGSKKYEDCVMQFRWWVDPVTGLRIQDKYSDPSTWEDRDKQDAGFGQIARWFKDVNEYREITNSNLDSSGISHPRNKGDKGPGNAENIVWMFGKQLHGFELNTLFGHYTHPGIYHKAGESHSHPNEEIIVYLSLDANDPMHLGAQCETALGEEDERYVTEVPVAYMFPKGFSHLPQTCRWLERPYAFMIVELDATHDSPWKERNGQKTQYEE